MKERCPFFIYHHPNILMAKAPRYHDQSTLRPLHNPDTSMDGHFHVLLPMADYSGLDCCHASLRYLLFWYLSFFVCPSLCCHHQYCLLQVEGDSSEDELHVPLESGIAHPGETIPRFRVPIPCSTDSAHC